MNCLRHFSIAVFLLKLNLFVCCNGQVNDWQAQYILQSGHISGRSEPHLINAVKCFFVIYGEFSYSTADLACRNRGGTLATFSTTSEERLVRRRIEWLSLPGYEVNRKNKPQWVGQLWVAAKRSSPGSSKWEWSVNDYQGSPMPQQMQWLTDDPYEDATVAPPAPQNCAVIRQGGWAALSCDGLKGGDIVAVQAGALCNTVVRTGPTTDTATNFCNVPLMPYSTGNLALPLVIQKSYFIVQGNFTWQDAFESCRSKDARLASIKSEEESNFILNNVDIKAVGYSVWISLKRKAPKSVEFMWASDRSAVTYNGFLPGQPKLGDDCGGYQRSTQGVTGWAVLSCNTTVSLLGLPMGALCETFHVL